MSGKDLVVRSNRRCQAYTQSGSRCKRAAVRQPRLPTKFCNTHETRKGAE